MPKFGEGETSRTLARLHAQAFREWLSLNLDQKNRDLARYAASTEGGAARLSFERLELARTLVPIDASPQESQLFAEDLSAVLDSLCPRAPQEVERQGPQKIERIA